MSRKWMGILATIDEPSTKPAGGSQGLLIRMTMGASQDIVAQASNAYLSHEHVDFKPQMYPASMIGEVEEAVIIDNKIVISGSIDDKWVDMYGKMKFGLSMEVRTQSHYNLWQELVVDEVTFFAGAAVVEEPAFGQSTFEVLS